ncbi:MAG: nitroreductase family protein [Anaerolineae bacterium]
MMDMTTFEQLLRTRHSVRRFRPDPVLRSLVRQLLELATLAPSAHNAQPWRFAVLTTPAVRRRLAQAMAADFRRDLEADGVPPARVDALVSASIQTIGDAPVVIVLSLSMANMDRYPDTRRQAAERDMAVQSVALAGGQLLLAAHAAGLGGVWLCAPRFCPETVRQTLTLPKTWEPQGLILLGHPDEPPPAEKARRPLSDVVRWYDNT